MNVAETNRRMRMGFGTTLLWHQCIGVLASQDGYTHPHSHSHTHTHTHTHTHSHTHTHTHACTRTHTHTHRAVTLGMSLTDCEGDPSDRRCRSGAIAQTDEMEEWKF